MTPKEFETVVKELDLTGFPARIALQVVKSDVADAFEIQGSLGTKERDSGESMHVYQVELVRVEVLPWLQRSQAESLVRDFLRRMVLHELDEQIRWGARRPFDPHRNEVSR